MDNQAIVKSGSTSKKKLYHFGYGTDNNRKAYSRQDSMTWTLQKLFQTELPNIQRVARDEIISVMLNLDLDHKNLLLVALATLIIYSLRNAKMELTPEVFNQYFTSLAPLLVKDVQGKTSEEVNMIYIRYKVTLYRYLVFVQSNWILPEI